MGHRLHASCSCHQSNKILTLEEEIKMLEDLKINLEDQIKAIVARLGKLKA